MLQIIEMTRENQYWDKTAEFAEKCEWRAGPSLAGIMKSGGFSGFERVFCALDGSSPAAFCTLSKDDCVPNIPFSPFIGFVYVSPSHRGNRLSEKLINAAKKSAKGAGFNKVYLCSSERGLYEKYGFIKLMEAEDKYGSTEQIFELEL